MNQPSSVGRDEVANSVLDELIAEITDKLQAGEPVDVQRYASEHPDLAEELRRLLPALELMAVAGGLPGGELAPDEERVEPSLHGALGDFRIVREVGRGGMGVVYEAEQISLRRRVALKVLPFAATMDPRQLQRFHNEAQAAACLHHTNIVPVFSVGCERGVHFYAMQFIDGQPLSEIIRQLCRLEKKTPTIEGEQTIAYQPPPGEAVSTPPPAAAVTPLSSEGRRNRDYYRKVAELGVQAAAALDHAHQLGIVHRDIKPANLLLDGRGNLWVTDFGLAHVQHSEASLTGTGQMVGTPRYMSPEQAMAKRVPIDHRADVYSLGATLYEMLTLRPAFMSEDRQELLRQITFEEPPRPRRLERAIPAELEIIVFKAMEKRPQDRYATALELADDLEHWLADRPIRARRPPWVQVARKWSRRHKPAVWAASVLLLALMGVSVINALWWVHQQTEAAKKQTAAETEARAALQEATHWQQVEKWSEALSAVRRAQVVISGFQADTSLQQQIEERGKDVEMAQKLEDARLEESGLKNESFDTKACLNAYKAAFRSYGLDVQHLDPSEAAVFIRSRSIRVQLVAALDHWASKIGKLYFQERKPLLAIARAVDPDLWRDRLRDALEMSEINALEDLVASGLPDELSPDTVILVAGMLMTTDLFHRLRNERVTQLLHRTQRRHPNSFWLNNYLGICYLGLKPYLPAEAIRYFTTAVALRPESPGAHLNLGKALRDMGRLDEALAEFQEAIRLRSDFAKAHNNLGVALAGKGRVNEAIAEYREALRLDKDNPFIHTNLGCSLRSKGLLDDAIAEHQEAIRLDKNFAVAHLNLGVALYAKGRTDEAAAEFREAIHLEKDDAEAHNALGAYLCDQKGDYDGAIAEFREAIRLKKGYAAAHTNLGNALKNKGDLDAAIEEYREALQIDNRDAAAHRSFGVALWQKGKFDAAIAEFREAIRLKPDDPHSHNNLANALREKGRLDEAIAEFREAIRLKIDYAAPHLGIGLCLNSQGKFRQAVEEFRRGHELGSRQAGWRMPSAQWLRNAEILANLVDRLPALLNGQEQPKDARERLALAELCQVHKKLFAASARWYSEAFVEKPQFANNLSSGTRYNAACAAALAGCGQGKDADKLDTKKRAHLRQQALDWLRADLSAYRQVLEKSAGKAGPAIMRAMQHWLKDGDFAGVRGDNALAKLPEAERKDWQKLWQEVEDLRQRAAQPPKTTKSVRP